MNCLPGGGGLLDQDYKYIFYFRTVLEADAEKAEKDRWLEEQKAPRGR